MSEFSHLYGALGNCAVCFLFIRKLTFSCLKFVKRTDSIVQVFQGESHIERFPLLLLWFEMLHLNAIAVDR